MIGETGERKSAVATPDGKSRKKKKKYTIAVVTDIAFFGHYFLLTNTFVEKSVSLWIQQRHIHY